MRVLEVIGLKSGVILKHEDIGVVINPSDYEELERLREFLTSVVIFTNQEFREIAAEVDATIVAPFPGKNTVPLEEGEEWYIGEVFTLTAIYGNKRLFPIIVYNPARIVVGYYEDVGKEIDTIFDVLVTSTDVEKLKEKSTEMNFDASYVIVVGRSTASRNRIIALKPGEKLYFTRHLLRVEIVRRVPRN